MLVVTSKVVSKVEGRLVRARLRRRGGRARRPGSAAIDAETVRVVARRGTLRIVETRHGLVLAAAGVDLSNVARNELALLPVDPDASAAAAARARCASGSACAVGVVDQRLDGPAVAGRASPTPRSGWPASPRSPTRAAASTRTATPWSSPEVAVADELAAAADLVKGKLRGVPVAVVRGLARDGKLADDGKGSRSLIRGAADDLFRLGTAEAIAVGREDVGWATEVPPALHADAHAVVAGADRRRTGRCSRRSSASSPPARTRCGAPAPPGT